MISSVPADQIDYVWNALLPKIEEALEKGHGYGETADHLYHELIHDRMFMIVVHEGDEVIAGGIFSIQNHPARKTLFVEILAGKNMSDWLDDVEDMMKKLRDHVGADSIEASCRPGLTRLLKNWTPKATIMELQ